MTGYSISPARQSGIVSLLAKYETWLIGEEVTSRKGRRGYVQVAKGVINLIPGAETLTDDELKAKIAASNYEEVLAFKEKVGWTKKSGERAKQNTASTNCSYLNTFLHFTGCPHKVKVPKRVQTISMALSREESKRLFEAAGINRNKELAARDRAIIALFLEGALRLGSVNVLQEDINLEEGFIILRNTKGGGDHKVDLAGVAVDAVRSYLEVRRPGKNAEENKWLLISTRNTALCDGQIYTVVKECAAKAKITRNVWPHLLRHTKLTDMARNNINPFKIQKHAGHKNINTTMGYVHLADPQDREEILGAPLLQGDEDHPMIAVFDADDEPVVRLTRLLAEGKIDANTYNRALDALTKKVRA